MNVNKMTLPELEAERAKIARRLEQPVDDTTKQHITRRLRMVQAAIDRINYLYNN